MFVRKRMVKDGKDVFINPVLVQRFIGAGYHEYGKEPIVDTITKKKRGRRKKSK